MRQDTQPPSSSENEGILKAYYLSKRPNTSRIKSLLQNLSKRPRGAEDVRSGLSVDTIKSSLAKSSSKIRWKCYTLPSEGGNTKGQVLFATGRRRKHSRLPAVTPEFIKKASHHTGGFQTANDLQDARDVLFGGSLESFSAPSSPCHDVPLYHTSLSLPSSPLSPDLSLAALSLASPPTTPRSSPRTHHNHSFSFDSIASTDSSVSPRLDASSTTYPYGSLSPRTALPHQWPTFNTHQPHAPLPDTTLSPQTSPRTSEKMSIHSLIN